MRAAFALGFLAGLFTASLLLAFALFRELSLRDTEPTSYPGPGR